LVENCWFRFLAGALAFQVNNHLPPQNITIRRNLITDIYSTSSFAQGMFVKAVTGLTLDENIFDHVGWNDDAKFPANVFNHDLYIVEVQNVRITNNMFLRDSSLHTKFVSGLVNGTSNVLIDNNLYFEGEVGITLAFQDDNTGATNDEPSAGSVSSGFTITNNVMLQINRSNPTGRPIGWGIEANCLGSSVISNNIFSDFSFTNNTYAISLDTSDSGPTSVSSDVTIQNNLMYQVHDQGLRITPGPLWSNIKVANNTIQDVNLGATTVNHTGSFSAVAYSGNTYYASNPANLAQLNSVPQTYPQWLAASSETGSQVQAVTYTSPALNLDTYMAKFSLGINDFYTGIRAMSKATWNTAYTATTINNYVRAGFNVPSYPATP
jgi:hypothetical protein